MSSLATTTCPVARRSEVIEYKVLKKLAPNETILELSSPIACHVALRLASPWNEACSLLENDEPLIRLRH